MIIKTEEVERLMKQCQIGVGGKDALNKAHNIMADCYGTLGALVQERDRLKAASFFGKSKDIHALAEMLLSDCGCSSLHYPLMEKVENRLYAFFDEQIAALTKQLEQREQGRPVKPHRSGGGMPAPAPLPPLPNYLAKDLNGVKFYDGFQMQQYAVKYAESIGEQNAKP